MPNENKKEIRTPGMFPIMGNKTDKPYPTKIDWSLAELAYSKYNQDVGGSQSLERLAERGGFYAGEMDKYLPDWRERCDKINQLQQQLAESQRLLAESGNRIANMVVYETQVNSLKSQLQAAQKDGERLDTAAKLIGNIDLYLHPISGLFISQPFICTGETLRSCLDKIKTEMSAAAKGTK